MTNPDEVLQALGRLVMEQRDEVILHHEWAVAGRSTAAGYAERHADLARFSSEQLAVVRREVIEAVDNVIHHLLFLIEQGDVLGFDLVFRGTEQHPVPEPVSVAELSVGLGAEPYGETGWINAFSRYENVS